MKNIISYTVELFQLEPEIFITSPRDVSFDVIDMLFGNCMVSHEEIHALYLDNTCRVRYTERLGSGNLNSCIINWPALFTTMHVQRMPRVMIIHNHPSGHKKFSAADLNLADQLRKSTETLKLELLDFLVVTPDYEVMSARNMGYLK